MKLSIKNNNLYYYHYPVFNGEISYGLFILIFILIYYYRDLIKYISYASIAVPIIGNYDAILKYKKYNLIGIVFFSILVHLPFLYPLIDFKKYFKPNYKQLIVLILSLLLINYLPYWPYLVSRRDMMLILILTYIILFIIYQIFF